jgi:hypothetical protein
LQQHRYAACCDMHAAVLDNIDMAMAHKLYTRQVQAMQPRTLLAWGRLRWLQMHPDARPFNVSVDQQSRPCLLCARRHAKSTLCIELA